MIGEDYKHNLKQTSVNLNNVPHEFWEQVKKTQIHKAHKYFIADFHSQYNWHFLAANFLKQTANVAHVFSPFTLWTEELL